MQALLDQVLHVSSNPEWENKKVLMDISREIARGVTRMVELAERLKARDWVDPREQMELVAEREMMKAAESIERAAQRLAELKLKKEIETSSMEVSRASDANKFDSGFNGKYDF